MRQCALWIVGLMVVLCGILHAAEPDKAKKAGEGNALKLGHAEYQKGHWKDALVHYEAEIFTPDKTQDDNAHRNNATAFQQALGCLVNLNQQNKTDDLVARALKAYPDAWRMHHVAAKYYQHTQHYGYKIGEEFHRGHHRGGGRYVNSTDRDRVLALRHITKTLELLPEDLPARMLAPLYIEFSEMWLQQRQAWKLQVLTDVAELPDFEEGHRGWGRHSNDNVGAPVDGDGKIVTFGLPDSFKAAKNDGERWRYCLWKAKELDPKLADKAWFYWAKFWHTHHGVHTITRNYRGKAGDSLAAQLKLSELKDSETVAKTASGIRRFTLAGDFDFIKIYKRLGQSKDAFIKQEAITQLGHIFRNRQQRVKAAEYFSMINDTHQVKQITGNWAGITGKVERKAGEPARFHLNYRNANSISFKAQPIDLQHLLDDVKALFRSNPKQINYQDSNIQDLAQRLLEEKNHKYLGEVEELWSLDLTPLPGHQDRQIEVTTPLTKPGAYWISATVKGGNSFHAVLWVEDMIIVKKPLHQKQWLYVADAMTGEPIKGATVEFFGKRQEWLKQPARALRQRNHVWKTHAFAKHTDDKGQLVVDMKDDLRRYQWVMVATTETGRMAYLGFEGMWGSHYRENRYQQNKALVVLDRPAYRPGHTLQFSAWMRRAAYDLDPKSHYANQSLHVRIINPKHETAWEKHIKADEYGGINVEWPVPKDAMLGAYGIQVNRHRASSFRIEEYKKPEYEVVVDAPTLPVKLGDELPIAIQARYFFGAPVTQGTVSYKILREKADTRYFAPSPWDWLYGNGYWWSSYDYTWYPGWSRWGCFAPYPYWWNRGREQPELVLQGEAPLNDKGELKLTIDSAIAKSMFGDDTSHRYKVEATVRDQSRRHITGNGEVLVAAHPFKVYVWTRSQLNKGDRAKVDIQTRTVSGKPVVGRGTLELRRISYEADGTPKEKAVQDWEITTDDNGVARVDIHAREAGQYRLVATVKDEKGQRMEGGYVLSVFGEGKVADGSFRFNDLELHTDRDSYKAADMASIKVNAERSGSTVLLFTRPQYGTYKGKPELLTLDGKTGKSEMLLSHKDMPNTFVEALTISNGKVHTVVKQLVLPPEKRVFDMNIKANKVTYKPGEKATLELELRDKQGKPVVGSTAVTVYDKALEYIAPYGVNDVRKYFWSWKRSHNVNQRDNTWMYNRLRDVSKQVRMPNLMYMVQAYMDGYYWHQFADFGIAEEVTESEESEDALYELKSVRRFGGRMVAKSKGSALRTMADAAAPAPAMAMEANQLAASGAKKEAAPSDKASDSSTSSDAPVTTRTNFQDTALFAGLVTTDAQGKATLTFDVPDNLTTWQVRAFGMGHGTRVGQAETAVTATKDVLIRLQAPRFFVETDEVVLSGIVHNYLDKTQSIEIALDLGTDAIQAMDPVKQRIKVKSHGEVRVDWRVKVVKPGEAKIRMVAKGQDDSDAMELTFPVYVHGIEKQIPVVGSLAQNQTETTFDVTIPNKLDPEQTRFEMRVSPSLALAMVDALPYLIEFPYGCTEQTLNRFIPAVITMQTLKRMNIDLAAIQDKRSNLNAQEIGDPKERAKRWKQWKRNPVFDEAELKKFVDAGVTKLTNMQLSDGGWGWFSGYGEYSSPHTTAVVVRGLLVAKKQGKPVAPSALRRGLQWLKNYENRQLTYLKNHDEKKKDVRQKAHADNLDAMIFMIRAMNDDPNHEMLKYLHRDREHLSVYAKAIVAIACHDIEQTEMRDTFAKLIEQFVIMDEENQTAHLNLGNGNYWWYWYGSEYEAHAYYLKLLSAMEPTSKRTRYLVKYLVNNRSNGTYWKSTRDTALCIEALSDYIIASKEAAPNQTVTISIDGKEHRKFTITPENLFTFDNALSLTGATLTPGKHTVTVKREGNGPLYFNAYTTFFTKEDHITKAGLEVKVERKYYRLTKRDKQVDVAGGHGQALKQSVEAYTRTPLNNLETVKSGDLVEIDLIIESKNDYTYLLFEDYKPAGFEAVGVRSGYVNKGLRAYREFRDNRVSFFVQNLARGKHSVTYRLRAEIPGKFSALPTKASAMYAPEIKANSDEIKLKVVD